MVVQAPLPSSPTAAPAPGSFLVEAPAWVARGVNTSSWCVQGLAGGLFDSWLIRDVRNLLGMRAMGE